VLTRGWFVGSGEHLRCRCQTRRRGRSIGRAWAGEGALVAANKAIHAEEAAADGVKATHAAEDATATVTEGSESEVSKAVVTRWSDNHFSVETEAADGTKVHTHRWGEEATETEPDFYRRENLEGADDGPHRL
jgi:hypothetical protein